jgi:hypothetical protein
MYTVTKSPWPSLLPIGTEIIPTEPREGYTGTWFKKADNTLLFEDSFEDLDGKFKLKADEYEKS